MIKRSIAIALCFGGLSLLQARAATEKEFLRHTAGGATIKAQRRLVPHLLRSHPSAMRIRSER